jgi:hypothetical protein
MSTYAIYRSDVTDEKVVDILDQFTKDLEAYHDLVQAL